MPVMFWIAWFGLRLVALTVLAALTAMTYDALQDRPTKRYSFAYAASLGGTPFTRERTHPTAPSASSSLEMRIPLVAGAR